MKFLLLALILIVLNLTHSTVFAGEIKSFYNKYQFNTNMPLLRELEKNELSAYKKNKNKSYLIRSKLFRLFRLIHQGETNQKLKLLIWLDNHTEDNYELKVITGHALANHFANHNASKIAIFYAKRVNRYCKKTNFFYLENLTLLGNCHYRMMQFKEAEIYFKRAYLHTPKSDLAVYISRLNNLALVKAALKKRELARYYYRKAISIIEDNGVKSENRLMYYLLKGNLGGSYYHYGQYQKAKVLYESQLGYFLNHPKLYVDLKHSISNLLDIYYKENNKKGQNELIRMLVQSEYFSENKDVYPYFTEIVFNHYSKIGNQKLKDYYGLLLIQRIKSFNHYSSQLQQDSENILLEEKLDFLNLELKTQDVLIKKNKQEVKLYLILLGTVSITFISIFYFIRKLHKSKQDLILKDQQLKAEKYAFLAMNINLKTEIEKAFFNKLKEIKRSRTSDMNSLIQELQFVVSNILSIDKKIQSEHELLDEDQIQFKNLLRSRHPNLNEYELQLCTFFKMKLTSKQIAAVFDTSGGAIRVHKNKIKNKITLDKSQKLEDYFNQLSNTK